MRSLNPQRREPTSSLHCAPSKTSATPTPKRSTPIFRCNPIAEFFWIFLLRHDTKRTFAPSPVNREIPAVQRENRFDVLARRQMNEHDVRKLRSEISVPFHDLRNGGRFLARHRKYFHGPVRDASQELLESKRCALEQPSGLGDNRPASQ